MNQPPIPPLRDAHPGLTDVIADADGHTKDGPHPLRALFQITPDGRLVWADR